MAGRAQKRVLGLVELRHRPHVVAAGAGQFLFGEDVFQHDAKAAFLALAGEAEGFFRRGERAFQRGELGGEE